MKINPYLPHISQNVLLLFNYICLNYSFLFVVYVVGVGECVPQHQCEGQRTKYKSRFSPSIMQVLVIRLGRKCHLVGPYFLYLIYIASFF